MTPFSITIFETSFSILKSGLFWAGLICMFFYMIFAQFASQWGVMEFYKILYDVLSFGFNLGGVLLGILWSINWVCDFFSSGAIETEFCQPLKPEEWFIARTFGVLLSLLFYWLCSTLFWICLCWLNNFGFVNLGQIWILMSHGLSWLVISSCAASLSLICSRNFVLMLSLLLWWIGSLGPLLANSLPSHLDPSFKVLVDVITWIWNIQIFNISANIYGENPFSLAQMATITVYAVCLIFTWLSIGCLILQRKDLLKS